VVQTDPESSIGDRSDRDLLDQDRILLRRGRLRVTAAYTQLSGLLEIDLNTVSGSQVRVSAAEVAYRVAPWPGAAVGLLKIPFGFEVGQSDKDRLFLERSTVVRALFPGEYDVGARLAGGWRFLRYAVNPPARRASRCATPTRPRISPRAPAWSRRSVPSSSPPESRC
jgi:hypothetical protein